MSTETVAKEILKQVKGEDATLTERVDALETNTAALTVAVHDNTAITKRIEESTSDLVIGISWLKTFTKIIMWVGGFGGALAGIFGAIYAYKQMAGGTGL